MQPWSQPLLWKGVATAVATCTYDPATVSAGAALSNGNLTVTHVSGSNQGAHLPDATDSKTTGKLYYEMTYTVLAGTINGGMIGVAVVGTSYTQFGLSTNSVTAYANGNLNTGGSNIYNYGARSVGNVIGVAIDLDNRLAWFKQVSGTPGNWNGNTANGNPVTLLNGITIPAGSIEPYTALGTNASDAFTINLGASAFTGAIPSGYSAWCPAVATTWNPSDKTTGMVLSNSNLTAYAGGTGGNKGVRSTASRTSGKLYFEIKVDTNNSSGAWSGVTVGTAFAPDVVTGDATHGAGVIWVTGNTNSYTTSGTSLGALAASNDILCFAIDIGGQLIWFRKNGGNWNGSGTANPATGIGGISLASLISTWGSGTFYAFTSTAQGFEQSTANFGWAAFSFAVPSGFVAWG